MNKRLAALSVVFGLMQINAAQAQDRPNVPDFYSSIETVELAMADKCETIEVRELEFLLDVTRVSQQQIDCTGFEYLGAKRFVELMFSDDELDLVIVLINPDEFEALSQKFRETHGEPTHDSAIGQFYYGDAVAIRTRPFEVVFASRRVRANYQLYMDHMGSDTSN